MYQDFLDKAKRKMIGTTPDSIGEFNVHEYVSNPPLIRKLFEEKQLHLIEKEALREELKAKSSEVHNLQLENKELSLKLNEAKQRSFLMFIISVLGSLLTGIGVNVATGNPNNWTGWVMIATGVILEIIVFLAMPR